MLLFLLFFVLFFFVVVFFIDGVIPVTQRISSLVASRPGTSSYMVNATTGWSGVNIMRLGEMADLIWNLYLSVVARTIV